MTGVDDVLAEHRDEIAEAAEEPDAPAAVVALAAVANGEEPPRSALEAIGREQ